MIATAAEPRVLSFSEFTARGGYDVEISHDRLRFPHGITKRQARDNRKAAGHHLREAFRAAGDYNAAVKAGVVRPPNESEQQGARLSAHPDHESTKATWRISIRNRVRRDPTLSAETAAAGIIRDLFSGLDPWAAELGAGETIEGQAMARVAWMTPRPAGPTA